MLTVINKKILLLANSINLKLLDFISKQMKKKKMFKNMMDKQHKNLKKKKKVKLDFCRICFI